MLQVLSVRVYLDNQQQLAQLHLTMVLLVLLLHQEALESQPQQTQQQLRLRLHQPQLAQLAVRLAAVQVHHLRAAVPHHLVLVLLLAVAVVVVLLLVHQDPQVEDTTVVDINTNLIYHIPIF